MTSSSPLSNPVRLWGLDGRAKSAGIGRHLLRQPNAQERYRAGGRIAESGQLDGAAREELYVLLAHLSARMNARHELWQTALAPGLAENANPGLPSGYTYLLQLIAHDIVDTVISLDSLPEGEVAPCLRNGRKRALMLDTLYGDGPAECSALYRESDGSPDAPRTHLRIGAIDLGTVGSPRGPTCPAHDFVRLPGNDALAADPRNDAHPIVAQMTLLFVSLHNWIATRLGPTRRGPAGEAQLEASWRRHLFARSVVTLIYRTIIERDLLPRILHPDVVAAYGGRSKLTVDWAAAIKVRTQRQSG